MLRKIFCIFVCLCFTSHVCFAQEAAMKTLNEGEAAPYSGTLLNKEAVAEMILKIESSKKHCELKIKEEREIQKANLNLAVDKLKIANNFEISVYKAQNDFLKEQIDLSVKHLEKKSVSAEWWFVGGFVVGALIALGSGYVANKIAD